MVLYHQALNGILVHLFHVDFPLSYLAVIIPGPQLGVKNTHI